MVPSKEKVTFRGREYDVERGGYDRATYQHLDGCLHKADSRMPCQCGAHERASFVYYFKVPPK